MFSGGKSIFLGCLENVCFFTVAGLTKQHVSDLDSIEVLIEQGNKLRFVLWYLQIFLVEVHKLSSFTFLTSFQLT